LNRLSILHRRARVPTCLKKIQNMPRISYYEDLVCNIY